MLPFDPHNPDHLIALLSKFRESNTEDQRGARKPSKKGAILDSLAHLAICKGEKQVISIGAVEKQVISATGEPEDCLEILIADNRKVDDSVPVFLTTLLKSLAVIRRDVKAAVIEASPPSLSSAIQTSPLLQKKLADLELSVVLHNLPKIRARFKKRYGAFQKFITYINDPKNSPPQFFATNKETLDDIVTIFNRLHMLLHNLATTNSTIGAPSVQRGLKLLYIDFHEKQKQVLTACTDYIRSVDTLEDLDMARWFSKLATTQIHFNRVSQMAVSSRLGLFLEHKINFVALDNPTASISFTLTRESFISLMQSFGWTSVYSQGFTESHLFDAFRDELSAQGSVLIHSEDEIVFDTEATAHSECVVLENLKSRMMDDLERPIDYVGVSKLSCSACWLYYKVAATPFSTKGTHSEFPPSWRCLTEDAAVRKSMCNALKIKVLAKTVVLEESVRRPRPVSQSTDGSVTAETWDGIVGDHVKEWGAQANAALELDQQLLEGILAAKAEKNKKKEERKQKTNDRT